MMNRRKFFQILVISLTWIPLAISQDTTTSTTSRKDAADESPTSLDYGILDWMRSVPGGFYHPDQEFRLDPETGAGAVFASKDIPKGSLLVQVPWDYLIETDDMNEEYFQFGCGTVRALIREMKLGNSSKYAPYIRYLHSQASNQIPSGWSRLGRKLLLQLVGATTSQGTTTVIPPETPVSWLTDNWFADCGGDPDDEIGIKSALLVIQRSDDHILIPAYDMYNHRNGKYLNTVTIATPKLHHVTRAARDILAGEQVYISYNECEGCSGRAYFYGTAEILRDYGFIEFMPQRWYYAHKHVSVQFDLSEDENGMLTLEWDDDLMAPPTDSDDIILMIEYFRRQVQRLRRLYNINYRDGNPGMPTSEWETAWRFQKANIQAMTMAMQSLKTMLLKGQQEFDVFNQSLDSKQLFADSSHYDTLDFHADGISYYDDTCNYQEAMAQLIDHEAVDSFNTQYQKFEFLVDPFTRDVVLKMDGMVRMSSSFRPHYNEYFVHAAARYIKSVQKVLFIGGGVSMLLHEILKYPELEWVVGLELDQTVPRKSLVHFAVPPHFDDPRVEWWFGDISKSLQLLPSDYWNSFDLVLVDLPETNVVTKFNLEEREIMESLAGLVKPDGVMVKNGLHMDAFGRLFGHSIQMSFICPLVCDQVLTMGSHDVDFMHASTIDHNVETLLYEPMIHEENRFQYFHDYRKNIRSTPVHCNRSSGTETPGSARPAERAGLMQILEVENISVPLNSALVQAFEQAVIQTGFVLGSDFVVSKDTFLVFLAEGYIVARTFPDQQYCNMDIHLWSKTDKLNELSARLTQVLGHQVVVSKFRMVVGGMFGSSMWIEDQARIGQQGMPKCEQPETLEPAATTYEFDETHIKLPVLEQIIVPVVEGVLSHVALPTTKFVSVALCGEEGSECLAYSHLNKSDRVERTIRLSACTGLKSQQTSNTIWYDCEIQTLVELQRAIGDGDSSSIGLVAIDSTAPLEMMQILNSILSDDRTRKSFLADTNVFMAWTNILPPQDATGTNDTVSQETCQGYFLDRYRTHHMDDPISRAEYKIEIGSSKEIEGEASVGIVSVGDRRATYHLERVESSVQSNFEEQQRELKDAAGSDVMNVNFTLSLIQGGKFEFREIYDPEEFLQTDYNQEPGLSQHYNQEPLAQHYVFQLEPSNAGLATNDDGELAPTFQFSKKNLNLALQMSLKEIDFTCETAFVVDDVDGDGCVMVCLHSEDGSVILTWDGRVHVDISYYRLDETNENLNSDAGLDPLVWAFQRATVTIAGRKESTRKASSLGAPLPPRGLEVSTQDEFPRGTGRVVNFGYDMVEPEDRESFFERTTLPRRHALARRVRTARSATDPVPKEGTCSNTN